MIINMVTCIDVCASIKQFYKNRNSARRARGRDAQEKLCTRIMHSVLILLIGMYLHMFVTHVASDVMTINMGICIDVCVPISNFIRIVILRVAPAGTTRRGGHVYAWRICSIDRHLPAYVCNTCCIRCHGQPSLQLLIDHGGLRFAGAQPSLATRSGAGLHDQSEVDSSWAPVVFQPVRLRHYYYYYYYYCY